jgi:hypothetical protein
MSNDLVQRLRAYADAVIKDRGCESGLTDIILAGVDLIEQQAAEIERLKEKLGSGYNIDLDHWRKKYAECHDRAEAAEAEEKRWHSEAMEARREIRRLRGLLEVLATNQSETVREITCKALDGKT